MYSNNFDTVSYPSLIFFFPQNIAYDLDLLWN